MEISDSYIAPWALPNEKFPLHLVWTPDNEVDLVRIALPPGLTLVSAFNVDSTGTDGAVLNLKKNAPWDYITVFLAFNQLPTEVLTKENLQIEFFREGQRIQHATLVASIVRPRLEIVEFPKEILLADDSDFDSLFTTKLRQTGFGPIRIHFEAAFRGNIVSERALLARQIVLAMAKAGLLLAPEPVPVSAGSLPPPRVEIDERIKEDLVEEIDKIIREGVPEDVLSEPALRDFVKLLREKGPEAIMHFLKATIETWLIDYLLAAFASHPGDQAELAGGPTHAVIDGKMDLINMGMRYEDPKGNLYETLRYAVTIKDVRTKPHVVLLPMNFHVETALMGSI